MEALGMTQRWRQAFQMAQVMQEQSLHLGEKTFWLPSYVGNTTYNRNTI